MVEVFKISQFYTSVVSAKVADLRKAILKIYLSIFAETKKMVVQNHLSIF